MLTSFNKNFNGVFSNEIVPTKNILAETEGFEPLEKIKQYVVPRLSKEEERICDMATD